MNKLIHSAIIELVEVSRNLNMPLGNRKSIFIDEYNNKYEIPLDNYVHICNMALQGIGVNYTQVMFNMNDAEKNVCTGEIAINGIGNTIDTIETSTDKFRLNDVENMMKFAMECKNRIENPICTFTEGNLSFTSLALSHRLTNTVVDDLGNIQTSALGHANILLIMKIRTRYFDTIKFYVYEPHGSAPAGVVQQMKNNSDLFLQTLKLYFERFYPGRSRINVIQREQISCPEGIQGYVLDNQGYCALISNLWLYILLSLMQSKLPNDVKEYLFDHLNIIEASLYTRYNTPIELYSILVNFSAQIISFVIYNIFDSKHLKLFKKIFRKTMLIEEKQFGMDISKFQPPKELMDDEEITRRRTRPSHPYYKDETRLNILKRRGPRQKYDKEEIKLEDCFTCTKNEDCKSNYCHKIKGGYPSRCKSQAYKEEWREEDANVPNESKCFGERCTNKNECKSKNCTSTVFGRKYKVCR